MRIKKNKPKIKKIECFIPESKELIIQSLCDKENYTRSEFIRRAIDEYIEKRDPTLIIKN